MDLEMDRMEWLRGVCERERETFTKPHGNRSQAKTSLNLVQVLSSTPSNLSSQTAGKSSNDILEVPCPFAELQ